MDDEQNLAGSFIVDGDEVKFQVTRKLDTGDTEDDFLIPVDRRFQMAWAVKTSSNNLSSRHSSRRSLSNVQLSSEIGNPIWGEKKTIPDAGETDPDAEGETDPDAEGEPDPDAGEEAGEETEIEEIVELRGQLNFVCSWFIIGLSTLVSMA